MFFSTSFIKTHVKIQAGVFGVGSLMFCMETEQAHGSALVRLWRWKQCMLLISAICCLSARTFALSCRVALTNASWHVLFRAHSGLMRKMFLNTKLHLLRQDYIEGSRFWPQHQCAIWWFPPHLFIFFLMEHQLEKLSNIFIHFDNLKTVWILWVLQLSLIMVGSSLERIKQQSVLYQKCFHIEPFWKLRTQ